MTSLGADPFVVGLTIKITTQAAVLVFVKPSWENGDVRTAVVHQQAGSGRWDNVNRSLISNPALWYLKKKSYVNVSILSEWKTAVNSL